MKDKEYWLLIIIMIIILLIVGCTSPKLNKTPLEEMLGQTYSNCQVKSIIKRDDETVLTCLYKGETMVIDVYTAEQTEEQIKDELVETLAANDVYWGISID